MTTAIERDPITVTAYASRLSRRRIVLTTAAVIAGMFLAAVDGTVVSTAMPTIIGDLHGIDHYAWVFSAYLLAEIATIPLWGRLADMYGRKRIFLSGMLIFLVGSMLSGNAHSMVELVLFRAVQGVGAGCLIPVAQTISADLYTIEQRAKISALYAGVFGFASIVGPFVGGFLTDHLSWRWVFYVNVPVGIAAAVLVQVVMIEPLQERHHHRLDWAGIFTLLGWSGLLVFALETGGRDYAWSSPIVVGCFVAALALLAAFLLVESRALEPLIPLDLFRSPTLRASNLVLFFQGMAMFGIVSFLPLFVQVVIGSSATGAGRVLTPLMLAMVVGSALGARLVLRVGFRVMVLLGTGLLVAGAFLLTRLTVDSTQLEVSRDMAFLGVGMGFVVMATALAAQNSVPIHRMGVAMGLVNFTRQLGGAIGVAVSAAVMLNVLTSRLRAAFGNVSVKAGDLLSPAGQRSIPPQARDTVRAAFADALHATFWVTVGVAVLAAAAAFLMPRGGVRELAEEELEAAAGRTIAPAESAA